MHSVLVLDQVAQTLAVVRSLGRAGYRVILGRGRATSEAESSRHCAEVWGHPPVEDPTFEPALSAFVDARTDLCAIFPVGEASAMAIGAMAWLDARGIGITSVRANLLAACRDKRAANELALAAGLHVPATRAIADAAGFDSFVQEFGYPVIVKPVRSNAKLFGRKAYIVRDTHERAARFGVWPADHDDLLIQRYVTGPLEQCDYVAVNGVLIGFFQAHALRTDRPDGTGFAVDFISDPIDAGVLEACRAFARAHAYTGPGLLQLVRSATDGRLYFVENNPRLSAGIAQAVRCGLDIPQLMLQAALGTSTPIGESAANGSLKQYQVGQRTYWLSRDLNGYFEARHELTAAERRRWRRSAFESLVRAHAHMTWDRTDPEPSITIYRRLLRRLLLRDAGAA